MWTKRDDNFSDDFLKSSTGYPKDTSSRHSGQTYDKQDWQTYDNLKGRPKHPQGRHHRNTTDIPQRQDWNTKYFPYKQDWQTTDVPYKQDWYTTDIPHRQDWNTTDIPRRQDWHNQGKQHWQATDPSLSGHHQSQLNQKNPWNLKSECCRNTCENLDSQKWDTKEQWSGFKPQNVVKKSRQFRFY